MIRRRWLKSWAQRWLVRRYPHNYVRLCNHHWCWRMATYDYRCHRHWEDP